MTTTNEIEIETLVRNIISVQDDKDHELERDLLTRKMMRQLYKELGDPDPKDYEGVGKYLCIVKKVTGYTTWVGIKTKHELEFMSKYGGGVEYHIKRPSETKQRIVENYTEDGWSCSVSAYNVACEKYMKHKDYDNLYIRFIRTRDCSKYEYILAKED